MAIESTRANGYVSMIDRTKRKEEYHSNEKMKTNLDNLSLKRNSTSTSNTRKKK
jgi:hypothetical protein